jgi:diguanylate cyclase (GGDEF)-like protein
VTYEAALGGSMDEANKPSAVQQVTGSVMDFIGSLPVRLVIIFLIGGVVVPFVSDFLYPVIAGQSYQQICRTLSDEAKRKVPPTSKILQAMDKYHLSWLYVTSASGDLDPATEPYAPDVKSIAGARYPIQSGDIKWRDNQYYEAVEAMGDGKLLHVGFAKVGFMSNALGMGPAMPAAPANMAYVWTVIGGLCAFNIALLFLMVSKPLSLIARATGSLLLARDAYSGVTGGGLDVSGAISEVTNVAKGLKGIRMQYDELVAARVAKDDELRREKKEFDKQKKELSKEYEDQLSQTQAKISELYTKEAEEEFINALGKELDQLKSSHQVCQRILDKLNDKFPTSIMFGSFFKADRFQRLNLDAWLGFDERAAQNLKKLDHTRIAREVFATNKHVTLGMEGMRDYGLTQMAQAHNIRTAVYLPIIFQSRNLGVVAIYFTTEGQTVQDRLRVLRNVVELASRVLHQNIQYEEEQEAARTDPLTGLRNKKFFYEIMPQVMDRAAINPEQNPVSLMIMDGDHFKSINDTYGHQIGDQMLQELSKIVKTCVRTTDTLEKLAAPGDYLIRYGGEEFIIVMENTDAKRAMAVAERVRSAIEAKSDWPAGIAKWTISIGVSTFPQDGKTTDDLFNKADTALYYVKEVLERNKSIHSAQVPKSYKSSKASAVIGGELGVFDPAALLQSLATAQKTGVLTVQAPDGRQLWLLFESGKPMQARMGKHAGAAAIVEFVSTFEEGNFNFQENAGTGKATMTKLPRLDESFSISKSLERILMDGALAQDNFNAAKKIIPTLNMLVRPVAPVEFAARWQQLGQLAEPPMPEEFNVMSDIVQKADGNTTLHNIFRNMEGIPTHLLWRAAALLIQHGLVQTKVMQ